MIQSSWALLFIEIHRCGGLCNKQPTRGHIDLRYGDPAANSESVGSVAQQSCVHRNLSTWATVESFVAIAAAINLQAHHAE
jgi:hypothetical protein